MLVLVNLSSAMHITKMRAQAHFRAASRAGLPRHMSRDRQPHERDAQYPMKAQLRTPGQHHAQAYRVTYLVLASLASAMHIAYATVQMRTSGQHHV